MRLTTFQGQETDPHFSPDGRHVRGDSPWLRPHWENVGGLLQNASLSPTGVRALFEGRGDIFTVPAEDGDWRNLTRTSGVAERSPAWSPDGRHISWFSDASGEYRLMIGTDLNLWRVEVESGDVTLVDTDQYAHPIRTVDPVWAPDSRWLAYAKRFDNQLHVVMVHSLEDGSTRQLTDGLSDALSPAWDAGGKYLYFLASTDYALNTGWLDMTSYERPVRRARYLAVLQTDEPSPFLPGWTSASSRPAEAGASPLAALTGPSGGTLHRYSLEDDEATPFLSPVGDYGVSADGQKLLYRSGASWGVVGTSGSPNPGDGRIDTAVRMRVDPREEWRQLFRETMYSPWIDHVGHRSDMNYLLDVLAGEVAIGHSFVFGGDNPDVESVPIGLLGADLKEDGGRYHRPDEPRPDRLLQ